ncbi:hypothetical protein GDO81_026994 [Engystomops pustulosus]|uniref:Uncharacterized protein n=1 Tax=Engystomops pustulosus TaxID=76066 RepID=A0AAV6Z4Q7_ENGPU|nr:hypothetical protein GDO81_026994 [Engystomops pustulosus]
MPRWMPRWISENVLPEVHDKAKYPKPDPQRHRPWRNPPASHREIQSRDIEEIHVTGQNQPVQTQIIIRYMDTTTMSLLISSWNIQGLNTLAQF